MSANTAQHRIPGDLTREQLRSRILRVDQAGELGAVRIYQGQRAVLGRGRHGPVLAKMAQQEQHHLDTFSRLIGERGVRPTIFSPIWHVAGFALGAGTALLGERAAMACTVAVEEAIDEHYAAQYAVLGDDEAELKVTIEEFRQEELEHRDIGLANEAEKAPAYPLLSATIKSGCKLAIWLSERF
jgi:ubiquinone biosynthesis monooxygenase Coq7